MSIESKIAVQPGQPEMANAAAAPAGPQASPPDLTKRRLMRGAAAAAPVLLTLRSGALAAATSCTGVKAINTTVTMSNGNGSIPNYGPNGTPPDFCIANVTVNTECPGQNQVTTLQGGEQIGRVSVSTDNNGNQQYSCAGDFNLNGTYSNVAIISSNAVTSLL